LADVIGRIFTNGQTQQSTVERGDLKKLGPRGAYQNPVNTARDIPRVRRDIIVSHRGADPTISQNRKSFIWLTKSMVASPPRMLA